MKILYIIKYGIALISIALFFINWQLAIPIFLLSTLIHIFPMWPNILINTISWYLLIYGVAYLFINRKLGSFFVILAILLWFIRIKINQYNKKPRENTSIEKFNKETFEVLFPNGEKQIKKIWILIADLTKEKVSKTEAENIYTQIKFRLYIKTLNSDNLTNINLTSLFDIINKYTTNKLNNNEIWKIIAYIMEKDTQVYMYMQLLGLFNNDEYDKKIESNENFWFHVDYPIPTKSIAESNIYLKNLNHKRHGPITYKRIWSEKSSKINKTVDKYEIYNKEWKSVKYLFLCPYYSKTSKIPPKEFNLNIK